MLVPPRPHHPRRQRHVLLARRDDVARAVDGRLVRVADARGRVARQDLDVGLAAVGGVQEEAGDRAGVAVDAGAQPDGGVEDVFLEGLDLGRRLEGGQAGRAEGEVGGRGRLVLACGRADARNARG